MTRRRAEPAKALQSDAHAEDQRGARLFAQVEAAKAMANDAHVDARTDLALAGALLLTVSESLDESERFAAARQLLRFAASLIAGNKPLPVPMRDWLSQALFRAARAGRADEALGLRAGRGRRADVQRRMRNVGQIHALMRWKRLGLEPAASAVLPTAIRANGESGSGEDASVLVKEFRAIDKMWEIKGPFLAEPDGYPIGNAEATLADLEQGRHVSVVFEHRRIPDVSAGVLLPRELVAAV